MCTPGATKTYGEPNPDEVDHQKFGLDPRMTSLLCVVAPRALHDRLKKVWGLNLELTHVAKHHLLGIAKAPPNQIFSFLGSKTLSSLIVIMTKSF